MRWLEVLSLSLLAVTSAAGTSFNVNTTADGVDVSPGDGVCRDSAGNCTLRSAMAEANALVGNDTINLAAGAVYVLTVADNSGCIFGSASGLPVIAGNITINGNGATVSRSTAVGTPAFRILCVAASGNLTLSDITLTGGSTPMGGGGLMNQGMATILRSTISGNIGGDGSSGAPGGGGIYNTGEANVTNSTVSGNTGISGYGGGGIFNASSSGTARLTIVSSTITDNTAVPAGRGDALADAFSPAGSIIVRNSIVTTSLQGLGTDCYVGLALTSLGGNIARDNSCNLSGPGDKIADPMLAPLAMSGGPTMTHALLVGSPAIDGAANCTDSAGTPLTIDQRGIARPQGSACDIGSFERQNAPSCSTLSLTRTNYPAGSGASSVAIGDFNGDSKPDLATANQNANTVSILLGNGDGTFGQATDFAVGSLPFSIAAGDINGDGKPDLVVSNVSSNNVSILFGAGNGAFSPATSLAVGTSPLAAAIGDLNADGWADIVTANAGSDTLSILLGSGNGSFSPATHIAGVTGPVRVSLGDVNGDNKLDIAVPNQGSNSLSVFLGNGSGSFSTPSSYAVGIVPSGVAAADFNNDGKPDLAVANAGGSISVLIGTGSGSFGSAVGFPVGAGTPNAIVAGDLNGDGKQDLAVAVAGTAGVAVFLGSGTGSFGSVSNFPANATGTWSIAMADFNLDGKTDLVIANTGSHNVSVFLNTCTPAVSYTISVSTVGSGSVTSVPSGVSCGLDCTETYIAGTTVSFTATPANGYAFTGWSGACTGLSTCNIIINSNTSVSASFADATPPETTIVTVLPASGTALSNSASTPSASILISFAGTDNVGVASFQCQLDGGSFTPCVSPMRYTGLGGGPHTFRVRAVDSAGNTDGSPATFNWTVVPPVQCSTAMFSNVGSSRVDLQACKLEYSIVSPK